MRKALMMIRCVHCAAWMTVVVSLLLASCASGGGETDSRVKGPIVVGPAGAGGFAGAGGVTNMFGNSAGPAAPGGRASGAQAGAGGGTTGSQPMGGPVSIDAC